MNICTTSFVHVVMQRWDEADEVIHMEMPLISWAVTCMHGIFATCFVSHFVLYYSKRLLYTL